MSRREQILSTVIVAILVLIATPVDAAQSFVYVSELACQFSQDCRSFVSGIEAYDATTGRLAARIPLPPDRFGGQMVLSPDGRRLYVSLILANLSGGEIAVIDTTRHQLLSTHAVAMAFRLTVSRDGSRVFVSGENVVRGYDTNSFALLVTIPTIAPVVDLVASPTTDRLYTLERCDNLDRTPCAIDGRHLGVRSQIGEYDTLTGAQFASASAPPRTAEAWIDLHVSRDGTRVYATATTIDQAPLSEGVVSVFNPAGWTVLGRHPAGPLARETVDSVARERSFTRTVDSIVVLDFAESATGIVNLPNTTAITVSADETRAWVATALANFPGGSTNALVAIDTSANAIVTSTALPLIPIWLAATPSGANVCGYQVDTTQSSWTLNGGSASIRLRTPCAWAATSDAPWAHLSATEGSGDASLTLTVDPNPGINTRTAMLSIGGRLVTVTQAGPFSQAPFGFIDTPAESSIGVSGALAVSGWALDDVGVSRVSVFRDPVAGEPNSPIFIGNATFVDGARPDVQAVFPAFPNGSRAGWGLQILTNVLPGQGNGTYRLLVFADDTEGHTTLLGTRTFTAGNTSATLPFGTIDTPGSGETVSGTILNFGWALTPQPKMIAADGSTIDVLIDGVVVGHPTYGFARSDIQALFPGYANTDSAVGYFVLDTTTMSNGLHSIAWVVRDNTGATQGIGSRFFTVDNP
jgi:hypothetical protein